MKLLANAPFTLDYVKEICKDNEYVASLAHIIDTANALADGKYAAEYDMTLVRGQGYYTGTVFEVESLDFNSSIAGGGRYDNLIGKFLKEQIPAVGFSIGFERIYSILMEKEAYKTEKQKKVVLIYEEDQIADAIRYAENLRKTYKTALYIKPKKLGKFLNKLEEQGFDGFQVFGRDEEVRMCGEQQIFVMIYGMMLQTSINIIRMKGQKMDGSIQVYYGNGRGKTTAALGLGIRAAGVGKQVIMVQFLKKKHSDTLDFLKKLEPELQIFRFEKAACGYSDLSPKEKQEQMLNIKNALGYSRKVLDTGQCDLLILDEIFGLVDYNIITIEELMDLIAVKKDSMDLILTGRNLPEEVRKIADCIYSIQREKEKTPEILAQGIS